MSYLFEAVAVLILAGFLMLSIIFYYEGSGRASFIAFLLTLILPIPFFVFSISENTVIHLAGEIVTFVTIICGILLIIPIKGKELKYSINNKAVVDERDILFSREELRPGTKLFDEYYNKNPDKLHLDNIWRSEPGLLSPSSLFYNKLAFVAAEASFDTVRLFSGLRDNSPETDPTDLSATEVTKFIKAWGNKLGSASIGIADMKDYHYYTTAGRGNRYGSTITQDHPFGIVILVEMDYEMLSSAPRSPVVMESSNQYLHAAAIATQVAVMIRKLGYKAKTHIDANYDVICPLVAKDAGLGEIGRSGMLISDNWGPRVRISVVTTDIPLKTAQPRSDSSVIKFCSVCRKCAVNCPANSIPDGPREIAYGVLKWQLDQESCFTYWNHCGTDCGRCISTCPYSHRNNWFHNMIRWGIRNNIFFLRLSRLLDDFFYGRRPSSGEVKNLIA